ncbi:MAG: hypothetical protein AAF215_09815 [Cyanobacteria bacterium P01_A01_bin.123]
MNKIARWPMVAVAGAIALNSVFASRVVATTESDIATLQNELELAVCLNEWPYALALIDPLIAAPNVSAGYRSELVQFRYQLQGYATMSAIIPTSSTCETVLARTIPADRVVSAELPLDWAGSIYALTNSGNPRPAAIRQTAQAQPIAQVVLNDADEPIPLLSPATPVDLSNGSNVVAGAVSTGYEVFSFLAGLGDRVSLEVDVTEVLPGALYTDDDSQLFLFDRNGRLLVENDDLSGLQSSIQDFAIPETGYYYAVITTYNNDPILNAAQEISGWSNNGGSNIEYTLTISGVTPTAQLLRPAVSEQ